MIIPRHTLGNKARASDIMAGKSMILVALVRRLKMWNVGNGAVTTLNWSPGLTVDKIDW